jgi:hypothetical protein
MTGALLVTSSRNLSPNLCRYLSEKARIIAEQGEEVVSSYPENDEAAGELLEILVDCESLLVPTRVYGSILTCQICLNATPHCSSYCPMASTISSRTSRSWGCRSYGASPL